MNRKDHSHGGRCRPPAGRQLRAPTPGLTGMSWDTRSASHMVWPSWEPCLIPIGGSASNPCCRTNRCTHSNNIHYYCNRTTDARTPPGSRNIVKTVGVSLNSNKQKRTSDSKSRTSQSTKRYSVCTPWRMVFESNLDPTSKKNSEKKSPRKRTQKEGHIDAQSRSLQEALQRGKTKHIKPT